MNKLHRVITRLSMRILTAVSTTYAKYHLKLNNAKYSDNLRVRGRISVYNSGNISFGKNLTINSAHWANPIGYCTHTQIQVLPGGEIKIGDNCGISNCAITSAKMVCIGDNVLIGADVKIYDTDFHPVNPTYRYGNSKDLSRTSASPIRIENGAFIGSGAIILKGVVVGKNSVVGAGSVVAKSIPENEVWAGNPARFVKKTGLDYSGAS